MFPLPLLNKAFRPIPLIAAGAAVAAALTCTVGSPRAYRQLPRPAAEVDPSPDATPIRGIAKEVVASDALAGRLTLVEAAALIGWLNDRRDTPLRLEDAAFALPEVYAGPGERTANELVCLHTITWIVSRAQTECPARAKEVRAALVAEFEAERACGREVILPAVSEPEGRRIFALAAGALEGSRTGRLPGYSRPDLRAYLEQTVGVGSE